MQYIYQDGLYAILAINTLCYRYYSLDTSNKTLLESNSYCSENTRGNIAKKFVLR